LKLGGAVRYGRTVGRTRIEPGGKYRSGNKSITIIKVNLNISGATVSDDDAIAGKGTDKFSDIIFQFQCYAAGSAIGTNVNQSLAVADFQAPLTVSFALILPAS